MEAPADPEPHAAASASAPLRAPEVARLREEQEKVTGRAGVPRSGDARSPPVSGLGVPRTPILLGPQPHGRRGRSAGWPWPPEGKCREKLLSRVLTLEHWGGVGERGATVN